MCGRYVLRVILSNLRRDFALGFDVHESDFPIEQRPRFNIAPTQMVSVIRVVDGAKRHSLLRWGFIPYWSKGETRPQVNCRGETVFEKPMFRDAAKARRCLVLADGFYEWKRDERDKPLQAYFVEQADGKPFAMAGIWDTWISPDGEVIESVCIITTPANAEILPIHHRMPVILDRRDYLQWLEGTVEQAQALIKAPPDGTMAPRPVNNRVNAVRNDDAENVAPFDPATAPPPASTKNAHGRQGELF